MYIIRASRREVNRPLKHYLVSWGPQFMQRKWQSITEIDSNTEPNYSVQQAHKIIAKWEKEEPTPYWNYEVVKVIVI